MDNLMKEAQLRRLREAIDLLRDRCMIQDQADIATAMGYSREGTISEIVNGKTNLSTKFVKSFAATYNFDDNYILTGKGKIDSKWDPEDQRAENWAEIKSANRPRLSRPRYLMDVLKEEEEKEARQSDPKQTLPIQVYRLQATGKTLGPH